MKLPLTAKASNIVDADGVVVAMCNSFERWMDNRENAEYIVKCVNKAG